MKLTALALLFSLSAFATDVALIRNSVIKITSKLEGTSAELRGSGLLFAKNGKRYVLTSDHVVGHATTYIKTTGASTVSGEKLNLKFLAAEWGNGLALLEVVNDRNPRNAVPYEELSHDAAPHVGAGASFYGYPFESTSLTEETFATLLNLQAPMPYFVLSRKLVELEAAVGEFGMSGGPAFTEDNHFLGVLAYQRILEESNENRVYTIPATDTVAWLEHYFKAPEKYLPIFSEPWFGQGNPKQLLLTNDGLLLMFHVADGQYRAAIGRMEHLIILSDGPTVPYEDKRGFMKIFKQFMKDNPWRPSEFGIVDRASGKPVLKKLTFPAQALHYFDEPTTSLFLVLGEIHEERFARVNAAAKTLKQAVADLSAELKASALPAWKALEKELEEVNKTLAAMPPHPQDPSAPGAAEFFTLKWMTSLVFQLEEMAKLPGWQEADAKAKDYADLVREALKGVGDSLQVYEKKP